MSLLPSKEKFDTLSYEEKKKRLNKYLSIQSKISKLNDNAELGKQYDLLLKLQSDIATRFGKFLVIDANKKNVQCCDDLKSALEVVYNLDSKKESFICQVPKTI